MDKVYYFDIPDEDAIAARDLTIESFLSRRPIGDVMSLCAEGKILREQHNFSRPADEKA
jgi:hypothetical protein